MNTELETVAMTGGMAIVDALIANGVDTLFGIPGAQMYAFFDALKQREREIRTYGARHEQTCGYMAFGYARSTGRPGVFSVVPGPGILNAGAALVTALGCTTPVLCVTGQVPAAFIGKGRGHLHEIPDQLGTLRKLTKWSERIERIEDAPDIVNEAFQRMLGGRPGPVAIEMAWDVMLATASVRRRPGAALAPPAEPAPADIEQAAALLAEARRPMIMTGSGAQHASIAVRELADALDAPVAALRGGRGVVAADDVLGISAHVAHKLWPETDALIGIGSRLEVPYIRWTGYLNYVERSAATTPLVRIDIDPQEMQRLPPDIGIVADTDVAARRLAAAVRRLRPRDEGASTAVRRRIAAVKAEARLEIQKIRPQVAYLDVIRSVLPRDGFFVTELTQVGFASYFAFPVYEPYTYVSEGFQGTLGSGFPTALGVKVANPDKAVVSITGDGGFMFAVQDLATAAQERIGLVTLLFNNDAYGNVMRDQQLGFGGRVIGSELVNPDFQVLAEAFGIAFHSVSSPEALAPCLAEAIRSSEPTLIEIQVPRGSETSPWEFINPPSNR